MRRLAHVSAVIEMLFSHRQITIDTPEMFRNSIRSEGEGHDENRTAGGINLKNNETGGPGDVRQVPPYVGISRLNGTFYHGRHGAREKALLPDEPGQRDKSPYLTP
jgi:hypothetical protein